MPVFKGADGPASAIYKGADLVVKIYHGEDVVFEVASGGAPHRYWRLNNIESLAGYKGIAEMRFLDEVAGTAFTPSAAFDGGHFDGSTNANPNVIDENAGTCWASSTGGGGGGWVAIDHGAAIDVLPGAIRITARNDFGGGGGQAPVSGVIEWSDDGSVWTAYANYAATGWSVGEVRDVAFTPL